MFLPGYVQVPVFSFFPARQLMNNWYTKWAILGKEKEIHVTKLMQWHTVWCYRFHQNACLHCWVSLSYVGTWDWQKLMLLHMQIFTLFKKSCLPLFAVFHIVFQLLKHVNICIIMGQPLHRCRTEVPFFPADPQLAAKCK